MTAFGHPAFSVEPWQLNEESLDLDVLAQTESLFALSNGHIGMRGNLDEGEPHGLPGTYLNSVYELRPLPYAEVGYGNPESLQSVVNVTNGKVIRLLVNDEPLDVRYGTLLAHRRSLDFRTGVLDREFEWQSPAGAHIRVHSKRIVSVVQRAVAAIHFEVEAIDEPVRIAIQSELVANETLPVFAGDPRAASALTSPLEPEVHGFFGTRGALLHRVRSSGLRIAVAMDHTVEAPKETETTTDSSPDVARLTLVSRLVPGERLSLTKFLAYGASAERSRPALADQVAGALEVARHTGWDALADEQRSALDDFWGSADVELDGDPEMQQAVRFAMFHLFQAAVRAERRPIPAKGLTGPGYDGHTFWDMDVFVLDFLTATSPGTAADALRWRQSLLPDARARAQQLGLAGAAFPWRTIDGTESSAYWPAGTAAFHIDADIAYAVVRYMRATEDHDFERDVGLELLVETARLWHSLGHADASGGFRIDGVTGPDEYSALGDNNVYTNVMAQLNLRQAAACAARNPDRAGELGVLSEETAAWHDAAEAVVIPYDERLGVHPQAEGFTDHQFWDFDGTRPDQYPLLLHFPYFDLYRKQVVKQADLILALHLRGDAFSEEDKIRDFDYYERITVRDSSLSACSQAVIAAEVGPLELAYRYAGESARMDLSDLEHNTRDGLHLASLAGTWMALVDGFGGMRTTDDGLSFRPALPRALARLCFHVLYRSRHLRVTITRREVTYMLLKGESLAFSHYADVVQLEEGTEVRRAIPTRPKRPSPVQPKGREPKSIRHES